MKRRCLSYRFLIDVGVLMESICLIVSATPTDPFPPVGSKNGAPPLAHVLLVPNFFFEKAFSVPPLPSGPYLERCVEIGKRYHGKWGS